MQCSREKDEILWELVNLYRYQSGKIRIPQSSRSAKWQSGKERSRLAAVELVDSLSLALAATLSTCSHQPAEMYLCWTSLSSSECIEEVHVRRSPGQSSSFCWKERRAKIDELCIQRVSNVYGWMLNGFVLCCNRGCWKWLQICGK